MSGNSLVLYSNTGRRLMFDTKDLVMPTERFAALRKKTAAEEKERAGSSENAGHHDEVGADENLSTSAPEAGVSQWFVKQWEAMKGFYLSRLWKDDSLQQLSLEEFTNRIADAVERRWEHHKEKQREAKRKKRQREEKSNEKARSVQALKDARALEAEAGVTRVIVVTNFLSLDAFTSLDLMRREALWRSLGALLSSHGEIEASDVVADGEPLEGNQTNDFDDRLALRVVFREVDVAKKAVVELNGAPSPMEPNRKMLVEHIPLEAVGLAPHPLSTVDGGEGGGAAESKRSFMDQVEEELHHSHATGTEGDE